MRTVAHVSDLHFGRTDPRMVAQLKERLAHLRPDLIVVSGDLTQRARTREFVEARSFLESLSSPQIVIPGNHDIALYNVYGRFVERLDKYRRYISEDVEPFYSDAELMVVSVNTARSMTFKGGRINIGQVNRVRERMESAAPGAVKILVVHHPLDLPDSLSQELVGRARMALRTLADSGIDLILSGHLHVSRFTGPTERLRIGGHTALLVQAGTAVSTRSRGELNSFNVIETASDRIVIQQRCWSAVTADFAECTSERYERSANGWIKV
jgi:3',5'-cyclic AMP phosphodiesterase CpdA